jgi:hypothetical protein
MFPRVKFGFAALLILQFIALLVHLLLLYEIHRIGQENFQVDPVWLQPLVVLILVTDGGGFVLMFIFCTSEATWETYRRLFYSSWVRMVGKTPTRTLRCYALQMATDRKLLDSYRPGYRNTEEANTFTGCDAVDWMLEHGSCNCREEAVQQCLQMVGKNLMAGTADQPLVSFIDAEDYTYRINRPDLAPRWARSLSESTSNRARAADSDNEDAEQGATTSRIVFSDYSEDHSVALQNEPKEPTELSLAEI